MSSVLTEKQKEAITLRARGFGNKQISEELGITDSALRQRLKQACDNLGARNVLHAVAIAVHLGIISMEREGNDED